MHATCRSENPGQHGRSLNNAPPAGLEPATPGLGNLCSIHLSYGGSIKTRAGRYLGQSLVTEQTLHAVTSQLSPPIEKGKLNDH